MRRGIPRLNFRTKVVAIAVVLVTAIQIGTLVPVLNEVRSEQAKQANRSLDLAGRIYDQYMQSRSELLELNVSTIVLDFPFRTAVGDGDARTMRSVLENHAGRAGIATAAVFDLDGNHIASIGGGRDLWPGAALQRFAGDPAAIEPVMSVEFIGRQPFHVVTVPVQAPVPIAWASLALPIDEQFAREIETLTDMKSTVIGFGAAGAEVFATTLPDDVRDAALEGVRLGVGNGNEASLGRSGSWITRLLPYHSDAPGVYVAFQLPLTGVLEAYGILRDRLIATFAIALALTIVAAIGLSRMVTRPIAQLVGAARRMAEGIYSQPIPISSRDEFAVLAHGFNSMQEAIAVREQDIVHMAHHDSLSGLPTREIIVSRISDEIESGDQVAIVNFVLHRFDEIASTLGHRTADRLIQLVAGMLRERIGEHNPIGHLNIQEFVIVLPGAGLERARTCVEEVQAMLRAGMAIGNANISLEIRVGIAVFPTHGESAAELLRCAAIARGHGRGHHGPIGVYERGQEERSLESIRIVGDFPQAMKNRELWVAYQPKVDTESLRLSGAEALVRWSHPKFGPISPETFVPAIERAGGISQLTRWVLEESVSTLARWRVDGLMLSMSVNISPDDLSDGYLVSFLESLCNRHRIAPESLTLEVTESSIMHDVENSLAVIAALRQLGCRVSIDDFGTGHSALAQLKRLPVDELKIDKSFVMNLDDPRDDVVVRTAIELGHQFGLSVVAEGVEDENSLLRLQQLGCELVQGFYISPALASDEFIAWSRRWMSGKGADIVALVERTESQQRLRR